MKDIKENVICSAIWYKELELKNPDILKPRGFLPVNVDCGIVLSGHRHHNCLYQMVAIYDMPAYKAGKHIEGFLTNKNRFVDREEGAMIFIDNGGQLEFSKRLLYSEDLY